MFSRLSGLKHVRSRTKGSVTVFLSLSIMIILSLVLALFSGARIGAVRMKTECVADIAMNSVLAEYSRELFDQYGLMMVDASYGSGVHSLNNVKEHLCHYVQKNFDRSTYGGLANAQTMTAMFCNEADLTGYSVATDNGGAVLKRQILSYMAAEPVGAVLEDVLSNFNGLSGSGIDSMDVEEIARQNQQQIDSIPPPRIIDEEGKEEIVAVGNPADVVNAQRGIGVLNLAMRDRSKLSMKRIDKSLYASGRSLNKGTGLKDSDSSGADELLIDEYFYEKCSRYGKEMDKALLKYQLEYLAFGQDSDYGNLEKSAQCIFLWREASNLMYLLGCPSKVQQAAAIASALSAVALAPELMEPIKYSILLAWSFAESISDLNILFEGGRVPLIKSDSTWKLGIMEMFNFRGHLGQGDCGEGLEYKDYLRIKLLMTPMSEKISRMMDVIEMDVRETNGNSGFMLDYCIDVLRAEIVVGTRFGYEAKIERIYGYEE